MNKNTVFAIKGAIAALALFVFAVVVTPSEVEPVSWSPPQAPDPENLPGQLVDLMDKSVWIGQGNLLQPESIAIGPNGMLYTGLNNGTIVVLDPAKLDAQKHSQTAPAKIVASTQGRPLGMVFHPDGSLIVADGIKGLLRVQLNGKVEVLSTEAAGGKFAFTDDVAVSADGRLAWFTDASSRFAYPQFAQDILEHFGHGRLLEYNFETRQTRVLLDGLQFANGVTVSADEHFILVNETGEYKITRFWLKGVNAGRSDTFASNLPGFPDNIRRDSEGHFWVALPSGRDWLLDSLANKPGIRKVVSKLAAWVDFPVTPTAMALKFDESGKVIQSIYEPDPDGYYYITQVTPADGRLYFGSVHLNGLAWAPLP